MGPKLTGRLELDDNGIDPILGLDGDDVVIVGEAGSLGHVGEDQAHGEAVVVADLGIEGLGAELEHDNREAAGIYCLELKARAGKLNVGLTEQAAEAEHLQEILEEGRLLHPQLQYSCGGHDQGRRGGRI